MTSIYEQIGGREAVSAARDMSAAHAGLGVTDEAFDSVVSHLVATLIELEVPDALIAAIGAKLAPLRAAVVAVPQATSSSAAVPEAA